MIKPDTEELDGYKPLSLGVTESLLQLLKIDLAIRQLHARNLGTIEVGQLERSQTQFRSCQFGVDEVIAGWIRATPLSRNIAIRQVLRLVGVRCL